MKPKFIIEIYDNTSNIISFKNNERNIKVSKTVKTESLVKAFKDTETSIESPLLPLNTIKYKEKGNTIEIILYYPPANFDATCFDVIYENCIRPGIIMSYKLNQIESGFTINKTSCFGVKDDIILLNDNTKLYDLPFPNIGSGGWICWGSNSMSGILKTLMGLNVFINRLFNSPFNNHLFEVSLLKPFGINNVQDFFKFIQNKPVFPPELLINNNSNKTIRSL